VVLTVAASRGRRALAFLLALVVVAGGLAAALAWGTLGERVRDALLSGEQDVSLSSRLVVLRSLGEMAADFPVFGVGFGAFRVAFPRYMPAGEGELWNQAHDDWAEVAVDGGLPALALVVWLTAAFWRRALRVRAGSAHRAFRLTRLGLLVGLGALTLHALVDFNHQIPANALLFVVAGGVALSPDREERP
jgi:O-antigen ligase